MNHKYKVCIFTETYYPVVGGGETQARLLAEHLAAAGWPVFILTRRSDAAQPRQEMVDGVMVYRLPPVGRGQLKKWGLLLSSVWPLLRRRREYDLLFVSGFRIVGVTAVLMTNLLRKQVVLKADSQGEMSGDFFVAGLAKFGLRTASRPFRLFLHLRNTILKHAHAFAVITPDIATELAQAGIPPQAIHMIPNSVDSRRFHPITPAEKAALRARLALPATAQIAVYTGRLVSYKGLPLLLRVWQALCQQHTDLLLLLVGNGGLDIDNCEAELQAYVAAQGMQRQVHFTGAVQNVPDYVQAADLFAFPSENDAFPSSLVEAMACQLPVVATPVGAIPQIVQDGQNGLLVPPGEFQPLYDALDTLLTDAALAARLGAAGWQTVQQAYTAEIAGQQYRELFTAVTARG